MTIDEKTGMSPSGGDVFRAGAAAVDITPPIGVDMAGYRCVRRVEGVHDPLMARALVLEKSGIHFAMIGLDLLYFSRKQATPVLWRIEEECGIPNECVMYWATHTHTGPSIGDEVLPAIPDATYMNFLQKGIVRAVRKAKENLQPTRCRTARGRETSVSFNRRAARRGRPSRRAKNELVSLLRDGVFPSPEGGCNSEFYQQASCIDPDIFVLQVSDYKGSAIATVVNFALHCDTVGGNIVSAGYPHFLEQYLQKNNEGVGVFLFANGCCGDINHLDPAKASRKGFGKALKIGETLGKEVVRVLKKANVLNSPDFCMARETLNIARRRIRPDELEAAREYVRRSTKTDEGVARYYAEDILCLDKAPEIIPTLVTAFRVGSVAFVGLPGEVFVELGIEIKQRSPFDQTVIVELANDFVGYIPTQAAFSDGGYETLTARASCLCQEAGDMFVDSAIGLLKQLR